MIIDICNDNLKCYDQTRAYCGDDEFSLMNCLSVEDISGISDVQYELGDFDYIAPDESIIHQRRPELATFDIKDAKSVDRTDGIVTFDLYPRKQIFSYPELYNPIDINDVDKINTIFINLIMSVNNYFIMENFYSENFLHNCFILVERNDATVHNVITNPANLNQYKQFRCISHDQKQLWTSNLIVTPLIPEEYVVVMPESNISGNIIVRNNNIVGMLIQSKYVHKVTGKR